MRVYINKKNITFIHIPKTGGNSVRKLLENYEFRNASKYELFFLKKFNLFRLLYSFLRKLLPKYFNFSLRGHASAKEYNLYMGPNWNDDFIFTIVRNPFSRMVSIYESLRNSKKNSIKSSKAKKLSFSDFVKWYISIKPKKQCEYIYSSKNCLVKKFEDFNVEVDNLKNQLNLKYKNIPHENKTTYICYKKYYNSQNVIDEIKEYFRKDFEQFNYSDKLST